MKRYNVLKDCVIESKFYQCGTVYTDACDTANKPYISVLLEHGFMKEMREHPKTVWELEKGEACWLLESDGRIQKCYWSKTYGIKSAREYGSLFASEKEAKRELSQREAKVILERDTKGFRPDWKDDNQPKYGVKFNKAVDELSVQVEYAFCFALMYFATEGDAEASIKAHEKEWKIYLDVEGDD